jgi:hypothetical protein
MKTKEHNYRALLSIIDQQGGALISTGYKDLNTSMTFLCAQGHSWTSPARHILRGSWCPECSRGKQKTQYQLSLLDLIRKKDGTLLIGDNLHTATIRCSRGHIFTKDKLKLMSGAWCRQCTRIERLKTFQEYAKERGGKCLSKEYVHSAEKLTFQCRNKHIFKAAPQQLTALKTWCQKCLLNRIAEKRRAKKAAHSAL